MDQQIPVAKRDYLEQDAEIRGQKYVCLSFISPESVLASKDAFLISKFLETISKDVEELFKNLSIKYDGNTEVTNMIAGLNERYSYLFDKNSLDAEYKSFIKASDPICEEFAILNKFQTSIRGIKVRGSYDSMDEAQHRANTLAKLDKNFNVYVAEVGCWCPWDPNPDELQNEYSETQLNTLMKKYNEQQDMKNEFYATRKDNMIHSISEENTTDTTDIIDTTDITDTTDTPSDLLNKLI